LGVIAVLILFALLLLDRFYKRVQDGHFIADLLGVASAEGGTPPRGERTPATFRFAEEFLARRTEFWLLYAQFITAAVFVGTIGALLLVGAVSLEAGLPALSGVVGIVLGKTLLSSHGTPQTVQEQGVQRAPANTTPPSLTPSGTADTTATLVADPGEWSGQSPISYSYAWTRRDDSGDRTIPNAQEPRYAVTADDANSRISVVVSAVNAFGTGTASSNAVLITAASGE
jgi:hypothetical protein